ncbi:MAG TPA: hypothetical protein VK511_03960, partial [Gemmatimonadaceae bacterium]|nr:hypothetical protein [Gemmatimonadaceae bacterium]
EEAWDKGKQGVFTPPMLSEKQANAVWERAADLQAATSSHPAPPVTALPPALTPASATSGIAMDRVRDSAVEAGISREHVDRAAEELGLVRGVRRGTRVEAPSAPLVRRPILTPLFAAPFRLREEADIEGEIAPTDYELIVESIRETLHDEGAVSSFGRTLTWSSRIESRKGRNVSVTLSPRNGRTRIRIDERLGQLAGGLYGGIVGGTSSLAVWAATQAFRSTHAVLPTIAAAIAVELTTFSIARTILGFAKRRRGRQLATLRARLETDVRESIAAGPQDIR